MADYSFILARISDLRSAASTFESSAHTVQQAMSTANKLIGSRGGDAGDIGGILNELAYKLNVAAAEIEDAASTHPGRPIKVPKPTPIGDHGDGQRPDKPGPSKKPTPPGVPPVTPPPPGGVNPAPTPPPGAGTPPEQPKNDNGSNEPPDNNPSGDSGTDPDDTQTNQQGDGTTAAGLAGVGSLGVYSTRRRTSGENEEDDDRDPRFVSKANGALRAELNNAQAQLAAAQEQLDTLQDRKELLGTQLTDLRSRLAAKGNTDAALEQAISAAQTENAAIDSQIVAQEGAVSELSSQVSDLRQRLNRVAPGAGANLQLIASLEGTRTSESILSSTYNENNAVNCVNWVCNQMPIPQGIPGNAKDWVENAFNHPEYGIRVGSEPLTGSVIVMQPEHSYANDIYGHVMYVDHVDSTGGVWVTDNTHHDPLLLSRLTKEISGPNIEYLYFPWQTRA